MTAERKKKIEHMSKMSDVNGIFKICAIDHREVYINQMIKLGVGEPTTAKIIQSKLNIIERLNQKASCYLLDPLYSVYQAIDANILADAGLMIGIEGNDYTNTEFKDDYLTDLIDIAEIAKLDGDCVKLFIYFYNDKAVLKKQLALVKEVSDQCEKFGIPLLLEPILAPSEKAYTSAELMVLNKEMVDAFKGMNVDIYKIIYPFNVDEYTEEENIKHMKEVVADIDAPFIILSSGVAFETFLKQLEYASKAGASGYAIGRTLWANCLNVEAENYEEEINNMCDIFDKISDITEKFGNNWKNKYK